MTGSPVGIADIAQTNLVDMPYVQPTEVHALDYVACLLLSDADTGTGKDITHSILFSNARIGTRGRDRP